MKATWIRNALAILITLVGSTAWNSKAVAADLSGGSANQSPLPKKQMEAILQVQATVDNNVLDFEISRDDIDEVEAPLDVDFTPAFELSGDSFFQPLDNGQAFLNGDIPLQQEEVNPFISQLLSHGIIFQAFHQHTPTNPQIWFVHFRAEGNAIDLANGLKAALSVTSIPFPQTLPSHPHTPLDPARLKTILHADSISVGDEGVVTAWIYRKDKITIDGIVVNPQANISTNVEFKPMDDSGSQAAVVPDFSMTSEETVPVISLMLNQLGWYQGCLYNQETNETPQLYFDHMVKTGDAYQLAAEIRQGLDLTNSD